MKGPCSLLVRMVILTAGLSLEWSCEQKPSNMGPDLDANVLPDGPVHPPPLDQGAPGVSPIDPRAYPSVGEKEMGHLRWMIGLAARALDDFTYFEAKDQEGLTSYRYSIAFAAYFLAIVQYHKLPAWTEAIQRASDRLIQKIILKPVWEYWANTSKGIPTLEPNNDRPYPESHDPVGEKNIMYSGHLGHMINLYEMLYRDFKWDKAGSIVFAWDDQEQYVYDNTSLEKVMYYQMLNNTYHSICCEPNAVFPECNQHPILSFLLYDHTHGTSYATVNPLFFQFFKEKELIDPLSHETAMLYLVKQGKTVSQKDPYYGNLTDLVVAPAVKSGLITLESSTANGWTGAFMHAWQPKYIEEQYPYWELHHVIIKSATLAELKNENWEPMVRYGFFALLAAELGDDETKEKLLNWSDLAYEPVWQDGSYHYRYDLSKGCTNLTDRLLAAARANPKNGLRLIHSQPFTAAHFLEPKIDTVDFPNLLIRRAIYDAAQQALVVTTEGGAKKNASSTFRVHPLDPAKTYWLFLDGQLKERIQGQTSHNVTVDLSAPHDIVLRTR
jgi:hypothetical protein